MYMYYLFKLDCLWREGARRVPDQKFLEGSAIGEVIPVAATMIPGPVGLWEPHNQSQSGREFTQVVRAIPAEDSMANPGDKILVLDRLNRPVTTCVVDWVYEDTRFILVEGDFVEEGADWEIDLKEVRQKGESV